MAYKILDISKWQPDVDYAKVAQAVDGVILRIGITYWGKQDMGKDICFEQHYNGFKAQNCPIGVYYYSAADSVEMAKKEAEYCLELMKGKQFELPIYYDVENNERQGALSKELLTQIVDAFCSIVESKGYFVGYYSYTAWLKSKFDTDYLNSKYTLWKADYSTAYDKTIPCDMHQYTSSGTVNGIEGRVDLNNCYRDFVSVIKGNGLNGFAKQDIELPSVDETAFSKESSRIIIGAMSKGDVAQMGSFLASLGIEYESNNEGFVITKDAVTYGDKVNIKAKADEIGNIGVKDYVVNLDKPSECAECDLLVAEIEALKAELIAEHDKKVWLEEKLKQIESIINN